MVKRLFILIIITLLVISPSSAFLAGDMNGDSHISSEEISSSILDQLQAGTDISQDLKDSAWMYRYWNGSPLTVTDTSNTTITLNRPLRQVIAFDGSTLETFRSINASNLVVGVSKNAHDEQEFFREFQNTTVIGTVWAPDIEALMKTRPDAIFIYGTISKDSVKAIEDQVSSLDPGIRVLHFDLFRPEAYVQEVRTVGKILGKQPEAETFLQFYTPVMNTIEERIRAIPPEQKKSVYFESWNAYKSAAPGSGYHEKVTFSGGRNIFGDAKNPYPAVDPEAVLRIAPEIVIKQVGAGEADVGGYNDQDSRNLIPVYESLLNRTGWNTLPAVQQGNVHIIHSDILGSSSHFIGMQYLAKWFYPEQFVDVDPLKTHAEYLTRFQHLQYNPATRGGFVYP